MESGKFRHRISLQRNQPTRNPVSGAVIDNWVEVAKVWARIEPLSARDFVSAQATQSKVAVRITIRHREIDASWRIVHTVKGVARLYEIHGVLTDQDSGLEYITLPCSAGVSINGQ